MLSHLATVLSALARHPASTGKELMSTVETFILELLNLTKDSILEAKGSEVLKASQVILDAVICLCKAYCNSTKSDDNGITEKDVQSSVEESDDVNQHHIFLLLHFGKRVVNCHTSGMVCNHHLTHFSSKMEANAGYQRSDDRN
ncbi:hypothetical protein Tco_1114895 [Tanacetum coccineum]